MSADEISAAQNPYGGWERETRAFGTAGGSPPPRWADFVDPLDAIGARFARRAAGGSARTARALSDGDRKHLRRARPRPRRRPPGAAQRYAELVRRYHPDRNGGDRSHEKALQAVIEAYTALKGRPALRLKLRERQTMADIPNVNPDSRAATVMDAPDQMVKVRDLFGIDQRHGGAGLLRGRRARARSRPGLCLRSGHHAGDLRRLRARTAG